MKENTENCIFCKLVRGEIPYVKIWEDDEFLAILDNQPNTEGQTLVITKEHYDSYVFDMPKVAYKNFMLATKRVAKLIEKGLGVKRIALVMEGMGVNHAHNKLYPIYKEEEGQLSTQLGEKKTGEELKIVADKIKGAFEYG